MSVGRIWRLIAFPEKKKFARAFVVFTFGGDRTKQQQQQPFLPIIWIQSIIGTNGDGDDWDGEFFPFPTYYYYYYYICIIPVSIFFPPLLISIEVYSNRFFFNLIVYLFYIIIIYHHQYNFDGDETFTFHFIWHFLLEKKWFHLFPPQKKNEQTNSFVST